MPASTLDVKIQAKKQDSHKHDTQAHMDGLPYCTTYCWFPVFGKEEAEA